MYIKVKTTPGAKKESIAKKSENHFVIHVKEKAERNRANKKVVELIANHFRVPISRVRIVNGHRHPSKLLSIEES